MSNYTAKHVATMRTRKNERKMDRNLRKLERDVAIWKEKAAAANFDFDTLLAGPPTALENTEKKDGPRHRAEQSERVHLSWGERLFAWYVGHLPAAESTEK